ncbi:hypothetical protein [Comamonas sp. JC664]
MLPPPARHLAAPCGEPEREAALIDAALAPCLAALPDAAAPASVSVLTS